MVVFFLIYEIMYKNMESVFTFGLSMRLGGLGAPGTTGSVVTKQVSPTIITIKWYYPKIICLNFLLSRDHAWHLNLCNLQVPFLTNLV